MTAAQYIQRIRNPHKRMYAETFQGFLVQGGVYPVRPAGLSLMGAQAVEMQLRDLARKEA